MITAYLFVPHRDAGYNYPLLVRVCPEWKPRPMIDSNNFGDQCYN